MTIWIIALLAVLSTFLGGLVALKFKDKLHLITGFSAGAVLGVAFFDLLPEAIDLSLPTHEVTSVFLIVSLGFLSYLLLDRFIFSHCHEHDGHCHNVNHRGRFGASSLSVHSFLDGLAVGLAFQISAAVGLVVAIAVLTHDFADGINTVGLVLRHGGERGEAFKWLLADALAPAVGIIVSSFFTVPAGAFGFILALFGGFFLYLGASDLLPESHHEHPTAWTTLTTLLGVVVLYLAISLAGI